MGFAFELGEAPQLAIRRVALELIDFCTEHLTRLDDPNLTIHEVRKATKKYRALLRLLRPQIGEDCYARENKTFRDVARHLADCRESLIRIDTLDSLDFSDPGLRERLVSSHEQQLNLFVANRAMQQQLISQLKQAASRVAGWPLRLEAYGALNQACFGAHEKARKRMPAAHADPSSERLHEWRKSVKHLWYHALLLTPCAAWPLAVDHQTLGSLASALGREHDLADLSAHINAAIGRSSRNQPLSARIDSEKISLRAVIFDLALPAFQKSHLKPSEGTNGSQSSNLSE
jgi:CHAD domain-containing protein